MTAQTGGPERVEEFVTGGVERVVAELMARCALGKQSQELTERCLGAIRNLTTHANGRKSVSESTKAMDYILRTLCLGLTGNQRRDAAGTMRNILLSKDVAVHSRVLALDGAGWLVASLILGLGKEDCPSFAELDATLDDERNEHDDMSPVLTKLFKGDLSKMPALDANKDARDMSVDCLILLGFNRAGREKMRAVKIYPAVRAYHPLERDEDLNNKVYDFVDLLISDEEDEDADKKIVEEVRKREDAKHEPSVASQLD